jgi:transcriptional regulator with XRE-family HTH domain
MEPRTGPNDEALRQALAHVLRELRCQRGLTQEQLAEAAGCHVNHVSFLERGLRVPSLLVAFQLAAALEVLPSQFVKLLENRLTDTGSQGSATP